MSTREAVDARQRDVPPGAPGPPRPALSCRSGRLSSASLAALLFVSTDGARPAADPRPDAIAGVAPGRARDRVVRGTSERPALNTLTSIGSDLAMTLLVFALTAVVAVVLRLWLGRWRESLALVICVLGEWVLFRLVNGAVDRQRPGPDAGRRRPRPRSFPSGHAGIAVAFYGGLALDHPAQRHPSEARDRPRLLLLRRDRSWWPSRACTGACTSRRTCWGRGSSPGSGSPVVVATLLPRRSAVSDKPQP